jgi:hypothetical protein
VQQVGTEEEERNVTGILTELEAARAVVARLERIAAHATCRELGSCDMQPAGGANCGCPDGCCSVPVLKCTRCGDCDYADNEEAREKRAACAATREIPEGIYFSIEGDNFYSIENPKGQGNEFYRYWKSRKGEFPQCDCQLPPTHISMNCPIHG